METLHCDAITLQNDVHVGTHKCIYFRPGLVPYHNLKLFKFGFGFVSQLCLAYLGVLKLAHLLS